MKWILIAWLVVNIYGLLLMRHDKRRSARGGWRVPESRLFMTAFFGGAAGVLAGMRLFRHKTKHRSFQIGIPLLLAWNAAAIIALVRVIS